MISYAFVSDYEPPMPGCELGLSTRATGQRVDVAAFLDTGADATLVPVERLQEIGARRAFPAGLRSQWGESRAVFLYIVDVHVGALTLPGQYVVGDDLGQECIVGRNVLNRLGLLLDGPARRTHILSDTELARFRK